MIKRLAVLTALAIGSISVAHADSINGAFAASGADSYNGTSITFIGSAASGSDGTVDGTVTGSTTTGTFFNYLGANGGESITYFPAFPTETALPFMTGMNLVPSNLYATGQTGVELFTVSGGGETFNFYMTDYDASYIAGTSACPVTCLDVTGDGYYTGSGAVTFGDAPGAFTFTSQYLNAQNVNTSFSASTDALLTPEPASLFLLGTGLIGAVGIARRKYAV